MSNYFEEHFGTVGSAVEDVEVSLIDVPEKELYVHLHGEGELVARGDNISPGYWKSEEATKASRVGEWFRTGDLGYIDDEGNVWITGRSKFVVVLDSGEKVHPDEIEEKLQRSPLIEDVALIGRKIRGKAQAWAVIYPNRDEVIARLGSEPATEDAVRPRVAAEINANTRDVAAYKRPTDFMLTDIPLPRTKPLRKIARGQIADAYTFDPKQWEQSWADYLAAAAIPAGDDGDEEAVATGVTLPRSRTDTLLASLCSVDISRALGVGIRNGSESTKAARAEQPALRLGRPGATPCTRGEGSRREPSPCLN